MVGAAAGAGDRRWGAVWRGAGGGAGAGAGAGLGGGGGATATCGGGFGGSGGLQSAMRFLSSASTSDSSTLQDALARLLGREGEPSGRASDRAAAPPRAAPAGLRASPAPATDRRAAVSRSSQAAPSSRSSKRQCQQQGAQPRDGRARADEHRQGGASGASSTGRRPLGGSGGRGKVAGSSRLRRLLLVAPARRSPAARRPGRRRIGPARGRRAAATGRRRPCPRADPRRPACRPGGGSRPACARPRPAPRRAVRRRERRQRLHLARPVGVPVDRLAVLVRLRIGQQAGRSVAQAAAHHAAQLRRSVVQRLAAHAQGAHAATRGDDQRALAGHSAVKIAGRLWRRDDL